MFKVNRKGQGALEYLLLIGGAVLIAVIVIALLVGMGGGARESAQDQADKAGDTLDYPQAPIVTDVVAKYEACNSTDVNISTINWTSIGEGGTYALVIVNNSNEELYREEDIDPRTSAIENIDLNAPTSGNIVTSVNAGEVECRDTHYAYIELSKNNVTVTSNKKEFSWSN